ncbi:hypothetical protein ACFWF7_33090 [Nocardia sp. NPDC060256]|uniref:hypothetical protein n=1 Tax=unclassified Nocardia TaxID=2637762 RepID=UPI0036610273
MSIRYHRYAVVILAGAVGAVSFIAQSGVRPAAAQASTVVMTCTEEGKVLWPAPGIGKEPAVVKWTEDLKYSDCKDPDGKAVNPHPVSSKASGTEKVSCNGDATDDHGTGTMKWSDGTTSEFKTGETSETVTDGNDSGEFPISITSGTYAGHSAKDVGTTTETGSCPGEKAATATGTLTIY